MGPPLKWTMAALVAVGLLFTWWARVYLGRLWSSGITRKADHHIGSMQAVLGAARADAHSVREGLITCC